MCARRNCAEEAPTRRWQVNYDSRQHPFLLRRVLVQDSVDGRSAHPGPLGRGSPNNPKFTRAASAASTHPECRRSGTCASRNQILQRMFYWCASTKYPI